MKSENDPEPGKFTDVGFNLVYAIIMLLAGISFVIWALSRGREEFTKYYFLLLGLILIFQGIYAISGKKYIRHDPHGKIIRFYGLLGIIDRKVKYDKLFFKGKDLYRLINGKTRYINLLRSQCKANDLEKFIEEIKTGQSQNTVKP